MFWIIFILLLGLAVIGVIYGNKKDDDLIFGLSVAYLIFGTIIWIAAAGNNTNKSKTSDREDICFNQPYVTPKALYIYMNDGTELKDTELNAAYFPFMGSKCYKVKKYNYFGNLRLTEYTFYTTGECKQKRTYRVWK